MTFTCKKVIILFASAHRSVFDFWYCSWDGVTNSASWHIRPRTSCINSHAVAIIERNGLNFVWKTKKGFFSNWPPTTVIYKTHGCEGKSASLKCARPTKMVGEPAGNICCVRARHPFSPSVSYNNLWGEYGVVSW